MLICWWDGAAALAGCELTHAAPGPPTTFQMVQDPLHYPHGTKFLAPGPLGQCHPIPGEPSPSRWDGMPWGLLLTAQQGGGGRPGARACPMPRSSCQSSAGWPVFEPKPAGPFTS